MVEILVPLGSFATIVLIVYIIFSTRNKERMALIEKGADASIFRSSKNAKPTLKYGLFLVGIGIGILFGNIIEVATPLQAEVAYFSMIFLFGGASLMSYYFYEKKQTDKIDE